MTSTVTTKGQVVVPKLVRERLRIEPGTTLKWIMEGEELRVIKLQQKSDTGFLQALRRLGKVPAAPRDRRPIGEP